MISADPQRLYIAFDWNILYLYLHVLLRDSEKKKEEERDNNRRVSSRERSLFTVGWLTLQVPCLQRDPKRGRPCVRTDSR